MTEQPHVLRAKGVDVERTIDGVMVTFRDVNGVRGDVTLFASVGDAAVLGANLMTVAAADPPDPAELLADSDDDRAADEPADGGG